eukprot:TRINITY_DN8214_c0_g1_i1.p1 TRINITY_DN8214_c0_g1~~TRINITY_DN8214_c0_g1_i1.p1  ORF type:complete len:230 (-),score=50.93 TRINITY_DN8214_c0_g1_i1:687-1274(-)
MCNVCPQNGIPSIRVDLEKMRFEGTWGKETKAWKEFVSLIDLEKFKVDIDRVMLIDQLDQLNQTSKEFNKILIEGYQMTYGKPNLEEVEKFGLKPGDKINRIGRETENGRQSYACRMKEFTPYIEYAGLFHLENREFMAFKLPEGGVGGFDLFKEVRDIYSLWETIEHSESEPELMLFDHDSDTPEVHKAVFNLC